MRQERDEPFDLNQATLIVTYGNTTRKYRPLDREVIVLGRAPNCDLNLLATEVAPLHCLLLRGCDGYWRVRHFGGRIGTLLNGKQIQDAAVDHDDTLQIGSFSFKFHLPPPFRRPGLKVDTLPDSVEACHLRRSRRNLVRLALELRRRCHESAADLARAEASLEQQEHDVAALRDTARSRQQALEVLRAQRQAEESDFLQRCQALDRQDVAIIERLRAEEEEITRRRAESEAAIRAAWEECQERCRAAEEAASATLGDRQIVGRTTAQEETRRLERRGIELGHYARHLRRVAEKVAAREAELVRRTRELARERDQLEREREATPSRTSDRPQTALPALRERLAKVQKMKKGLAMLRSSDSAPGVALKRSQDAGVEDVAK